MIHHDSSVLMCIVPCSSQSSPSNRILILMSSSRRAFSASAPTKTWPQTSCSAICLREVPSSALICTVPLPPSSISSSLLQTTISPSISSTIWSRVVFFQTQCSFCKICDSKSLISASIRRRASRTATPASLPEAAFSCSTALHISPKRRLWTVSSACRFSGAQHTTTEVYDSPVRAGCRSIVSLESLKGTRGRLCPCFAHRCLSFRACTHRFKVKRPLLM
mmetsp:Transcript_31672/g.38904  ORF Transcript_31672/g.38904 Transcript_31672/m.38904 type:complete len:221 (+) Transcript_31672:13-675(+)